MGRSWDRVSPKATSLSSNRNFPMDHIPQARINYSGLGCYSSKIVATWDKKSFIRQRKGVKAYSTTKYRPLTVAVHISQVLNWQPEEAGSDLLDGGGAWISKECVQKPSLVSLLSCLLSAFPFWTPDIHPNTWYASPHLMHEHSQ